MESIVSDLQREKFGARSEKLSGEQYHLPLEDVEIAQGVLDAAHEKAQRIIKGRPDGAGASHRRNRGDLPAHLPRVDCVQNLCTHVPLLFSFRARSALSEAWQKMGIRGVGFKHGSQWLCARAAQIDSEARAATFGSDVDFDRRCFDRKSHVPARTREDRKTAHPRVRRTYSFHLQNRR
ncbi:transposase [Bosea sp. CRIB-10]|uniref:transposase n=1 Tax=Bosea sp. CRIB-10 TaxID=378404 RepID=UPI001FCD7B1B|nr:transposase [Bosea sp. CRIB-10]